MKINQTKTQVHLLYTFTGMMVTDEGMINCFELADDYAYVLRLPWSDYTVTFPWDAMRQLKPGDTVSVIYDCTHNSTPRLRWKAVDWYKL